MFYDLMFWVTLISVFAGWAAIEYAVLRLSIIWNTGILVALAVLVVLLPADSIIRTLLITSSTPLPAVLLRRYVVGKLSSQQRYLALLIALPLLVGFVLWRRSQWPG